MMELDTSLTSEGIVANSTLLLLHVLAVTLKLQEDLQKTNERVQVLESACQNNRPFAKQQVIDRLESQIANISSVLQARTDDAQPLWECQKNLKDTQNLVKALPTVLKGREMKDAALEAAKTGNTQELRIILDAGADVDTADKEGRTLLSWASANGHVQTVRFLLERNATVDQVAPGWFNNTPMMIAAWNGHLEVAKALLEHGSVLEHRNNDDATELHHAAIKGRLPIVKLLVEKGADIHAKMNNKTVLEFSKKNVAEWLTPRILEDIPVW